MYKQANLSLYLTNEREGLNLVPTNVEGAGQNLENKQIDKIYPQRLFKHHGGRREPHFIPH